MECVRHEIDGVLEIIPSKHLDNRGFFSETYNKKKLTELGIELDFVQDNQSLSNEKGVLRGLHFQLPPFAQAKLIRVTKGRIFDVAVDIRVGSPTYSKWVGVELSAEKWNQLLIPIGFAHGFMTLEADCEIQYKASAQYSPSHDRGIRFDDAGINIDWPELKSSAVLSEKDKNAPLLKDIDTGFTFT